MKSETPVESTAEPQIVSLTVGTAGHIDHGKTELVKYLTGCNTDRLPEERARGMTIDLGFATCELPDHRRVGIVDVPGHERFIHNMVAGAAGIDAVVLVVAADDGVMPQTLEHFHIVRLLGISSGMVVVTKTDLASAERVQEVVEQVRELTADSFLDGCPVTPMSSKTGAGFSEFYDAFVALVARTAERDAGGPFRMHVERAFVLQGLGTIVSGIPRSGTVRVGDPLVLLPDGKEKRVRGLQVYGRTARIGRAGECVALRLSDLSHEEAGRGNVLAAPGYFTPTRFVNARFHLLPGLPAALKPRTAVRFHIGTSDVPGHLVLPELHPLRPGHESYVQLQLKRPVVAAPGDFFVVRLLSPAITLGGGNVLAADTMRMRRSRGTWEEECRQRETAFRDHESAVAYALRETGTTPLVLAGVAKAALVNEETARAQLDDLLARGEAVRLPGERYLTRAALDRVAESIVAALDELHDASPLAIGFTRRVLVPKLEAERLVIDRALEELEADERVLATACGYQLQGRAPVLTEKQALLAERIEALYREQGYAAPRLDELPVILGAPPPLTTPIINYLLQAGTLISLDDKVTLHTETLVRSRRAILDWFAENPTLDVGIFKQLIDTSRKFAIPILEYWDKQGITRRVGNDRILRNPEAKENSHGS